MTSHPAGVFARITYTVPSDGRTETADAIRVSLAHTAELVWSTPEALVGDEVVTTVVPLAAVDLTDTAAVAKILDDATRNGPTPGVHDLVYALRLHRLRQTAVHDQTPLPTDEDLIPADAFRRPTQRPATNTNARKLRDENTAADARETGR